MGRCSDMAKLPYEGTLATLEELTSRLRQKDVKESSNRVFQHHLEAGAALRQVRYRDRPGLPGANAFYQRKPQSQSLTAHSGTTKKGLKNLLLLLDWNTAAAVFYAKPVRADDQSDKAVLGVMQCVTQQVAHYGAEKDGIIEIVILTFPNILEIQMLLFELWG